ncbi:RING/U-box superfamily protein [Raphanus sativus]|nr:RING/U-box superfamily protein [Raphanus sativus]
MKKRQHLGVLRLGLELQIIIWLSIWVAFPQQAAGLRPIREKARTWSDEWLFGRKQVSEAGRFSAWNITGTYRGNWKFLDSLNNSSKFQDFQKSNGNSVVELVAVPTKITGVHYVQGVVVFHDVFDNEQNLGGAQISLEGVYIWPFRQLRLVANSGKESDSGQDENNLLSNPYHLLGIFSSQVFQESTRDRILQRKISPRNEMDKHCNIELAAQISRVASSDNNGDKSYYHMDGLMESPGVGDDGDCFSPMLLNATSLNVEVYYNKAVNYTLMVTFVSFAQNS